MHEENIIYLKEGNVYFYVGFLNKDLTIPGIETWLYCGEDMENGHVFKDAVDEAKQYCFPEGISSNILDHKALSLWLLDEHSPKLVAKEYEYKFTQED